jgi:Na+-translocating ferredoxin:NAD+ oxidoreductase subunit A
MTELISISLAAIFINNYVLSQFLGLCPFISVDKKLDSVLGMGLAVTFVMVIASALTYLIYFYLLNPHLIFLRTIVFILVITGIVQIIELIMKKTIPGLYSALGIYLPLITANCAILGVSILNINQEYNFIKSIVNGASAGIGFLIALILMATIKERLELSDVPKCFKGMPITFISAGLMALAFLAVDRTMLNFIK